MARKPIKKSAKQVRRKDYLPANKKKDDTTRAAVMASLLEGQGVNETARKAKVSKATASRIKHKVLPETLKQAETGRVDAITDLVMTHLRTSLHSANKIAETTSSDAAWIRAQGAGEIAVFYGVLSDKAIRILEAIEEPDTPEGPEEEI